MFADPETASRGRERLELLTGLELASWIEDAFEGNPSPDLALNNLERWLHATSSPGLHLQQLISLGPIGGLLITLFGASQPIADTLIQNPELASLVLDPSELRRVPTREMIVEEGRRLLSASTSYTHSLDRLRFLKQRWNLTIVMNDLSESWPQVAVWLALSDLADALIELARDVVWQEVRKQRDLPESCPVTVIAFGKLGGHEVNYSSDVDLAYVLDDGLDEKVERDCYRYCEAFGRALSDRMGRGSLYRVDLRLRPYGAAGPILRSMRSFEAYYNLYAEPWEVQALLRSRPVAGTDEAMKRWWEMRTLHCFKPRISEMALEHMLEMRERIEQGASEDDLKRAAGGIRDVEFLTQVLQMVHGFANPTVRVLPSIEAIRALEGIGEIEHAAANALTEGYEFLRKLEHRAQVVGDQQTHMIPAKPEARENMARLMRLGTWAELERTLSVQRRTIQSLYRSTLNLESAAHDDRAKVLELLGPLGPSVLQWFDLLPEREAFYGGLLENEGSLTRVRMIAERAPRLISAFKESVPLTEMLLSGEIEEDDDPARRIALLPLDDPLANVARVAKTASTAACARWALKSDFLLGLELGAITEGLLLHAFKRLNASVDVLALGSFGTGEMSPSSDADILCLVEQPLSQPESEIQLQQVLSLVSNLHRLGSPVEVDLRLRPDGGKGMLVRTYEGLRAYDFESMEMWERFALGHARLILGKTEALRVVHYSAYSLPLTPERLKELVSMKKRVESERVEPQHVKRNVKLGHGGLNDLEWLVHLTEMRYPTATKAGTATDMVERINGLGRAYLLNAIEVETLIEAHRHLLEVRNRIYLLGLTEDLVPENPDKLGRLASSCGLPEGNDFLAKHEQVISVVRAMFLEGLERLKA